MTRLIRWLHVGSFVVGLAVSGGLLVFTSGCQEDQKATAVVPPNDPKVMEAQRSAREELYKNQMKHQKK